MKKKNALRPPPGVFCWGRVGAWLEGKEAGHGRQVLARRRRGSSEAGLRHNDRGARRRGNSPTCGPASLRYRSPLLSSAGRTRKGFVLARECKDFFDKRSLASSQ